MTHHPRLLATLALGLALLTACGDDTAPLDPPDLQRDGLRLGWTTGRGKAGGGFEPTWSNTLELEPAGRFTYTCRDLESEDDTAIVVRGTWHRETGPGHRWRLEPETGRKALKEGVFADGAWPILEWSDEFAFGGGGPGLGAVYLVPTLDPDTGRIRPYVSIRHDPRGLPRSD